MGSVNLTGVTPALFATNVVFIFFTLSMFSMLILRLFQQRRKAALMYGAAGAASIAAFVFVIQTWFV